MTRTYWLVAIILVVAAWSASAILAPGLPARAPTHWNMRGQVDGYGPKALNLWPLPVLMTAWLVFFRLLPMLSPKQFEGASVGSAWQFLMVLVVGFFGYMHGLVLYATASGHLGITTALIGGAFLVFALLGNVLGKVRRNSFIGLRLPWTLASDRVWDDTHRLASWLCVLCGLVGFAIVMAGYSTLAAVAVLSVALVVPAVYSFVHYKRLGRRGGL